MVKLKVLKAFFDKEKSVTRNVDETFEVTEKRAKEILAHPLELVELVETVETVEVETVEEVPKPKKKKKAE